MPEPIHFKTVSLNPTASTVLRKNIKKEKLPKEQVRKLLSSSVLLAKKNKKRTQNIEGEDPYFPFAPDRGYIDLYGKNNSVWYWHFRAKEDPENAPLVLWFQGGPGSASTMDVFYSNGPFEVFNWPKGGKKATLRKIFWAQKVNIIYPDFPLGVGFSTVTSERVTHVGKQVQKQALLFFENLLERYPEYIGRPLYIAGVSYGGHWVPHVATALKYSQNPDIQVKGFYISDGLIDAKIQDESYLPFALKYPEYTKFTQKFARECTPLLNLCIFTQGRGRNKMHARMTDSICKDSFLAKVGFYILSKNPEFSPYFMPGPKKSPKPLHDYSFVTFLNNRTVQEYLGVRKTYFQTSNMTFSMQYTPANFYVDMKPYIARLLDDGVKGAITVGDMDFMTNYIMSEKVTSEFGWKYQKEFNAVPRKDCKYGLCKEYKNLREIRVAGAGHGISQYKPEYALEIISALVGVGEKALD